MITSTSCGTSSNDADHGVLLVGWGSTFSGINYWIVENSWGASYGMNGYVLIGMDGPGDGYCAINTVGSYPITKPVAQN